MDLKHTTKAELVAEIAALRKQLAEVEKERDALKGLAEKQRDLVDGWEKTCKEFRDLFFECFEHPWRNLLRHITGRPSLGTIWGQRNED